MITNMRISIIFVIENDKQNNLLITNNTNDYGKERKRYTD